MKPRVIVATGARLHELCPAEQSPFIEAEFISPDVASVFGGAHVIPDVITEAEEEILVNELRPRLEKRSYLTEHWDHVISKYRELQTLKWADERCMDLLDRLGAFYRPNAIIQPLVHILDYADGYTLGAHVDHVSYCGDHIVGLSLLSDCVIVLRHQESDSVVRMLIPRRSVYVMRDEARYHWAHEIRCGEDRFAGRSIQHTHRIALITRSEPLATS